MSPLKTLAIVAAAISANAIAGAPPGLNEAITSWAQKSGDSPPQYKFATVDLNGDATNDAVVLLLGDWCGSGGCTLAVFKGTSKGFTFVSKTPIVREPIGVLTEASHGWQTMAVFTAGGGSTPATSLLQFNGTKYSLLAKSATSAQLKTAKQLTLVLQE